MKIASIALKTPSLKISNSDIIDYIGLFNPSISAHTLNRYQREIAYLLKKTGARNRYYRDRDKKELAISFAKSAITEALANAQLDKSSIDLMIFCGVGRGFKEPANAYFFAKMMGMNCECFDVVDACMSWVRSAELAYMYLQRPEYQNILIVNAEFSIYEHGFPEAFKINHQSKIAYTFPAYTIGEAATATILSKSDDKWKFDYKSVPEAASYCTIPLPQYAEYCQPDKKIGLNGINQFVSFGGKLFEQTVNSMSELIASSSIEISNADLLFPHGAALDPILRMTKKHGVPNHKVINDAFPEFGNLISASIPAAMKLASETGTLSRGMKCLLCPASAGMSFALVEFTY